MQVDRDALDERWCARQDALAVGDDPAGDAQLDGATDPRWALEDAFYEELRGLAQPWESSGDLELIERAIASEPREGRSSSPKWWLAPVLAAAAVALIWLAWPGSDGALVDSGSWIARAEGTRLERGQSLPLSVWLVADKNACGTVEGATLCAEEGAVLRIVVRGGGAPPRVEVEQGGVSVRAGSWTVLTPEGERILAAGESIEVVAEPPTPEPQVIPPPPIAKERPPKPATVPESKAPPAAPAPKHDDAATLLARARSLRGKGDAKRAAQTYAELIKAHPKSAEANAARVSLGQLRLKAGRSKAALSLFNRYLRSGGALAEEALWGKIQALDALGRKGDLTQAVQELERRFPRSVYRSRARERLRE